MHRTAEVGSKHDVEFGMDITGARVSIFARGRVGARIAPNNREAKIRRARANAATATAPPRRAAGASR